MFFLNTGKFFVTLFHRLVSSSRVIKSENGKYYDFFVLFIFVSEHINTSQHAPPVGCCLHNTGGCLVSLLYVKYALQTLRVGASVWFGDMSLFPGRYHVSHRARRCAASNHRPRLSLFGRDTTDLEKGDV